jgi:hypothetical protein
MALWVWSDTLIHPYHWGIFVALFAPFAHGTFVLVYRTMIKKKGGGFLLPLSVSIYRGI